MTNIPYNKRNHLDGIWNVRNIEKLCRNKDFNTSLAL